MRQQRQPTPKEYAEARAKAQESANRMGMDHGLEWNSLMGEFHVWMLPRRENRRGHELRCEVVSPEDLEKCLPDPKVLLSKEATKSRTASSSLETQCSKVSKVSLWTGYPWPGACLERSSPGTWMVDLS